jgi:hypothetical protein
MLLVVIGFMILVASFNSEKVADWYWDMRYNAERNAAANLMAEGLVGTTARMEARSSYEEGDHLKLYINTPDGPFQISDYQPRALEHNYVANAWRGGSLLVYYNPSNPHRLVLAPTYTTARSILHKPKPRRVPDDAIARFVSLWGKGLGGLLILVGLYNLSKR